MMELLHPEIQRFIVSNTGTDAGKLALSKNPFPDTDWKAIINQIAARSKAREKLPTWFNTSNILWPAKISVEQTSSEITAAFKSGLIDGKTLIDLTGGFGVDDHYFAQKLQSVVHCEINPELSRIAKYNSEMLQTRNIEFFAGDGTEILKRLDRRFDWIYIDPSRRNDAKGKVFLLKDCLPDVPGNLDFYFSYADRILVKVSPILDISAGISEFKQVKTVFIVAIRNEVKELLWLLEKGYSGGISVVAVDLANDSQRFEFALNQTYAVFFAQPSQYLYEPNAAVMKSGGFDAVSQEFNVAKLHGHSHLYTSENLIDAFPGRIFKITETVSYNKTGMKKLSGTKANVTTRNFPESVEALRKKWKITDGGNVFYFFTTNSNNEKIVLLCAKI